MNNNVENSVEETFDQMLDSVKSINDEFINSYFEDDKLEQIIEESRDEEEYYDESSLKELSNDLTHDLFENEDELEKTVENFNVDDFKTEESIEMESEEIEKETSFEIEQNDEIEEPEIEEDIELEPESLSDDEIINLIDKTDSSEEFFNMLEGKMDDQ